MNIIKWNGKQYMQSIRGEIIPQDEVVREDEIHNIMMPSINTRMNENETTRYCPKCNTAYRISESRDGRCPMNCWMVHR